LAHFSRRPGKGINFADPRILGLLRTLSLLHSVFATLRSATLSFSACGTSVTGMVSFSPDTSISLHSSTLVRQIIPKHLKSDALLLISTFSTGKSNVEADSLSAQGRIRRLQRANFAPAIFDCHWSCWGGRPFQASFTLDRFFSLALPHFSIPTFWRGRECDVVSKLHFAAFFYLRAGRRCMPCPFALSLEVSSLLTYL
jgi:hypothetical protein